MKKILILLIIFLGVKSIYAQEDNKPTSFKYDNPVEFSKWNSYYVDNFFSLLTTTQNYGHSEFDKNTYIIKLNDYSRNYRPVYYNKHFNYAAIKKDPDKAKMELVKELRKYGYKDITERYVPETVLFCIGTNMTLKLCFDYDMGWNYNKIMYFSPEELKDYFQIKESDLNYFSKKYTGRDRSKM